MSILRKLAQATVGDATHIPQISYDEDGKIISATQVGFSSSAAPTGAIVAFGGAAAPTGWAICDGSSQLRAGTFAALFGVIGTTYGSVDGTHFNLPDLRDRTPEGTSTRALGATSGGTTHLHTVGTLVNGTSAVTGVAGSNTAHTHDLSGDTAWAQISMASGTGWVMRRLTVTAYTDNIIATATGQSITGESVSRSSGAAVFGATGGVVSGNAWSQTGSGTAAAQTITGSTANATGPIDPRLAITYIIAL